MARFCLNYKVSPTEYLGLTRAQRQAFYRAAEEINEEAKRNRR